LAWAAAERRAGVTGLSGAGGFWSVKVSVSGHVYDIATGRVTTTLDARYP